MRKVLTTLFLAAALVSSGAQEYITAWHSDGSAQVIPLSQIDSLTFTTPQGVVALTTGAPARVGANSVTAYFTATSSNATGAGTERGVCYSQQNATPTIDSYKVVDGSLSNGSWGATMSGLESGKPLYYRAYAIVGGKVYYGDVRSMQADADVSQSPSAPVDLGLSVLWAAGNAVETQVAGQGLSTYSLSAKSVYTIVTKRAGWLAGNDGKFKSTSQAGTDVSSSDNRQLFAFVPDPKDSTVFYLYSVGQNKFVKKDGNLSTNSADRIYVFKNTNDATYSYFFSFSSDQSSSNINIGGGKQVTIDGWKQYDDGNKCSVTAVSANYDLAAAQAKLINSAGGVGYYAWGETSTKNSYLWSTYKYGNGTARDKYTTTDGLTTLAAADDAATAAAGDGWRLPTKEEFEELQTKCTWKWEIADGQAGYRVIAANGNTIFLPAAGFQYGERVFMSGENGYYLTNTRGTDDSEAITIGFCKDQPIWSYPTARFFGYSIRPVRK